jgi:hypothetical protein
MWCHLNRAGKRPSNARVAPSRLTIGTAEGYFRYRHLIFIKAWSSPGSVKLRGQTFRGIKSFKMEILTAKAARRSTRMRVEIPITVTSMDRKHPFAATCVALVVSPQGCGFRASKALPIGTPVLLGDLPGGGSVSARVANCLPLGSDGEHFLIGVSLYNHGNVWGIADPPADWNCGSTPRSASAGEGKAPSKGKNNWPYNLFSGQGEAHPGRK